MTVEQVSSIQYVYSDNVYQCSREYNDARTIETPTTRSREAAKRLCRDAQGDGPRKPEDSVSVQSEVPAPPLRGFASARLVTIMGQQKNCRDARDNCDAHPRDDLYAGSTRGW